MGGTVGASQVFAEIVVAASAVDAVAAGFGPRRIIRKRFGGIAAIAIPAPLPHIAVHIKQSPGIGREARYRDRFLAIELRAAVSVRISAVVIGLIGTDVLSGIKGRNGSCTCRIFPFGFRGQTVAVGGTILGNFCSIPVFPDGISFGETFPFA